MKKPPLELRPTQFVLGMKEVENKVNKIKGLGKGDLKEYLDEHVVPCVEGPSGGTYLIDHHHFVHACWQAGIEEIKCDVVAQKQDLDHDPFWDFMKKSKWVYLFDQFGAGPHDPKQLPMDIRCLSDDPYRSLAWELRNAGVIEKVQKPFSEFTWAAFLRKNMKIDFHTSTWDEAVAQAVDLVKAEQKKAKKG